MSLLMTMTTDRHNIAYGWNGIFNMPIDKRQMVELINTLSQGSIPFIQSSFGSSEPRLFEFSF